MRLDTTQLDKLAEQGWCVTGPLFGPDECDLISLVFESVAAETRPVGVDDEHPPQFQAMRGMQIQALSGYLADPRLVELVIQVVGDDLRVFWEQAVTRRPDATGVLPWHQDAGYSMTDPVDLIGIWIALTDTSPSNGGIRVRSGSHKQGLLRHVSTGPSLRGIADPNSRSGSAPQDLTLAKGQALVFSPFLIHGSAGNPSDQLRRAWVIHYANAHVNHAATGEPLTDRPWVARGGRALGRFEIDDPWSWKRRIEDGWIPL